MTPKHELNKSESDEHDKLDRGKPRNPQYFAEATAELGVEVTFLQGRPNQLLIQCQSALKICIQVAPYRLDSLYLLHIYTCAHTHMHGITISFKRGHEFEEVKKRMKEYRGEFGCGKGKRQI